MVHCGIPQCEQTPFVPKTKRETGAKPGYGARIREAYLAAGFNRNSFTKALGTTYTNVTRWEKETAVPGGHYLGLIASTCHVSEAWVLRGSEEGGSADYREWLEHHAPRDLNADERKALAQIALPGKHPGPLFYSAVLTAWRMGSSRVHAAVH